MLPIRFRLVRQADIGRVRQNGRRWPHPLITLFVYTQPQESAADSRFAFAVGRHIGKAVQRNRVKRRMREIVRLSIDRLEPGFDCLFVARPEVKSASHEALESAIHQLMAHGGVLKDSGRNIMPEGSQL